MLPHMRQSWETLTSVSAGHIILTPTQPVGSGRPQWESNPGSPHQESRVLPTELPPPPPAHALIEVRAVIGEVKSPLEERIPREISCADDMDFIDRVAILRTNYNLRVNVDKTEKTMLIKNDNAWKSTKKVGSVLHRCNRHPPPLPPLLTLFVHKPRPTHPLPPRCKIIFER